MIIINKWKWKGEKMCATRCLKIVKVLFLSVVFVFGGVTFAANAEMAGVDIKKIFPI